MSDQLQWGLPQTEMEWGKDGGWCIAGRYNKFDMTSSPIDAASIWVNVDLCESTEYVDRPACLPWIEVQRNGGRIFLDSY
jgi:hypothetical protein